MVKEDSLYDSTLYLHSAELDSRIITCVSLSRKVYKALARFLKGCFVSLLDEPMFMSKSGLKAIVSTAVTQTRSIQDRSHLINNFITEKDLSTAKGIVFKDKLYIAIGNDVFVADGRQKSKLPNGDTTYEWHHWTNIGVTAWAIVDDELWFARSIASDNVDNPYIPIICKFNTDIDSELKYTDNGSPIISNWDFPIMTLGNFMQYKFLGKERHGYFV